AAAAAESRRTGRTMRGERYRASTGAIGSPNEPAIARRSINGVTSAFTSVFRVATMIAPIGVGFFAFCGPSRIGYATARYLPRAWGGVNSKINDFPESQSTVVGGRCLSPTDTWPGNGPL